MKQEDYTFYEQREVVYEFPPKFLRGRHYQVEEEERERTTIVVVGVDVIYFNNPSATTITNLIGGYDGQQLRLIGDGVTTLQANSFIITNTGVTETDVDLLLEDDYVYTFTCYKGVWRKHI